MMFRVFPPSKYLDINKPPLETSLRVVLNTQHSKRKLASNRLNLPKVLLSTQTVSFLLPKANSRLMFVGLGIRQASQVPSQSLKTVQDDTFVSCLCEFDNQILPKSDAVVGIDVGIKHMFVTDSGLTIDNPRLAAKYATKLAKAQKALSRKKLGSANRAKARMKVARIHAKILDCRLDNLHKLSRKLINDNQVICVETLRVKNMIKNPKLAQHIMDASWGRLIQQLEYKADWAGRSLVKIDQFFPSSKRCCNCGYTLLF